MVVSVQTALSANAVESGRANAWENRDDDVRSEFWPYLSEMAAGPTAESGLAVRRAPGNGQSADEIVSDSRLSLSAEQMVGRNSASEIREQGTAYESRRGSRDIQSVAILNSLHGPSGTPIEDSTHVSEAEIASLASPSNASDPIADVLSLNAISTGQPKMSPESTVTSQMDMGAAVPSQLQTASGATQKLPASKSLETTDADSAFHASTEAREISNLVKPNLAFIREGSLPAPNLESKAAPAASVSAQLPVLELDASVDSGPALTPDKNSPETAISSATVNDGHQGITSSITFESTDLGQQATDMAGADNQFQLADTPRADRLANPVQSSSAMSNHTPRVLETIVAAARALGERPVELTLNPEELGRVRMTLHATDSGMAVQLIVERPETLDLLRRNIDLLAGDLRQMGYERLSFAFSNDQGQGGDPSPRRHLADQIKSETMMSQSPALPEPLRLSLGGDGLDLRI